MKFFRIILLAVVSSALSCAISHAESANPVRASQFGALPDDGKDDNEGVRAALAACSKTGATLLLDPGVYQFAADKLARFRRAFDVREFENLTIDGQGSTLIFNDHANPFFLQKCRNATLKNFKIDWDRLPFSQGKVVAATAQSIDVQVDEEYPVDETVKVRALMDYDPETRLPLANLDVFEGALESVKKVGPQLLRITFKKRNEPGKEAHKQKYLQAMPGNLVVLRHEVYGNYAIDLLRCENTRLENISIYAVPGMGIHASMCRDISSDRVEVRIKPESRRLMSTTADCQYYTFCMGTISVQNGFYEGMGDDGLNVTAKYRKIGRVDSPTSFLAAVPSKGWQGPLPEAGEKLQVQSKGDLSAKGGGIVRTAKWDESEKAFAIELEEPIEGLETGDLIYSETYLPKVKVSHSTFQGMRSRAILLSTRSAEIKNCKIRGPGYVGVLLKGGLRHGVEGPAPSEVTISDCEFEDCGGAAIYAYADAMNRAPGVLKDIVIERNTIRDTPALAAKRFAKDHPTWMHWNAGICLLSSANGRISGNTFSMAGPSIYLRNVRDVTISNNHSESAAPVIVDEPTCSKIELLDNGATLAVQSAQPDTAPDLEYLNDLR